MPSSQLQALSRQWREIAEKMRLRDCRERLEKVAVAYDLMATERAERESEKPVAVTPAFGPSRDAGSVPVQ